MYVIKLIAKYLVYSPSIDLTISTSSWQISFIVYYYYNKISLLDFGEFVKYNKGGVGVILISGRIKLYLMKILLFTKIYLYYKN